MCVPGSGTTTEVFQFKMILLFWANYRLTLKAYADKFLFVSCGRLIAIQVYGNAKSS